MHGKTMGYVAVAAGALAIGLFISGTPLESLLPFALVLACPIMMLLMMRGMGAHGQGDAERGQRDRDHAQVDR